MLLNISMSLAVVLVCDHKMNHGKKWPVSWISSRAHKNCTRKEHGNTINRINIKIAVCSIRPSFLVIQFRSVCFYEIQIVRQITDQVESEKIEVKAIMKDREREIEERKKERRSLQIVYYSINMRLKWMYLRIGDAANENQTKRATRRHRKRCAFFIFGHFMLCYWFLIISY